MYTRHKKLKSMKKTLFLTVTIGMLIIQACDSDNFKFETDKISDSMKITSSWALPLVSSSVTLEQILPDDEEINRHLIIDDDGFITISVEDKMEPIQAKDFFGDKLSSYPIENGIIKFPVLTPLSFPVKPQVFQMDLDDMSSSLNGFYCANPTVTVSVKNYWPVPVRLKFDKAYYYKTIYNTNPKLITGEGVTNWYSIKIPESVNTYATTDIVLDKNNSNLPDVISDLPNHVSFGAIVETLPEALGNTYSIPVNSADSLSLTIKIPLELKMTDVSISDTIKLDLASNFDNDTSIIQYVKLNTIFNNGFPVNTNVRLFLADDMYNILDEITDNDGITLQAGNSTDATNKPVESKDEIVIEGEKRQSLLNAKHLIVKLKLNTNDKVVKLYSKHALGIKLAALIKLKYKNDKL